MSCSQAARQFLPRVSSPRCSLRVSHSSVSSTGVVVIPVGTLETSTHWFSHREQCRCFSLSSSTASEVVILVGMHRQVPIGFSHREVPRDVPLSLCSLRLSGKPMFPCFTQTATLVVNYGGICMAGFTRDFALRAVLP